MLRDVGLSILSFGLRCKNPCSDISFPHNQKHIPQISPASTALAQQLALHEVYAANQPPNKGAMKVSPGAPHSQTTKKP